LTLRSFFHPLLRSGWRRLAPVVLIIGAPLGACTVGPDYIRPPAPPSAEFKEATAEFKEAKKGWKTATPRDGFDRGPWWSVYHDPKLASLMSQVEISNQTVIAAAGNYEQARAIIREAQAGYFPTVTNSWSGTASYQGAGTSSTSTNIIARSSVIYNPMASMTWDIDVWGKIRRMVESDAAAAQFSAADLQNAKLSAQATLATAYFNLRASDSLKKLLADTIVEYKKTLEITRNQYTSGVASQADVITAETQVLTTEAQEIAVGVQRAQFEHAIAVLIGKPPSELTLAPGALAMKIPHTPVSVPSTLLERRPDIAAAERLIQEQNALIGVAVAAFYPDVNLTGMFGFAGGTPLPIAAANEVWSLAGSVTQTVFDGGLRSADLAAAKAVYEQSVANYRQTTLTAFQQVEDQLAAIRILTEEAAKQDAAVKAAREAVQIYLNQYRAGTVAFTAVVTAEGILLADEETALSIRQSLFVASVALIEGLGGGWDASLLPSLEGLTRVPTITPPL
jgi:NodT family efflux transporter outer membrane factor (OMF) lipoprotein